MEGKILVTLLIFLVFLLYVKSTSTYITSDLGYRWHSQYQNIGMDIDPTAYDTGAGPGKRYPVAADQDLSQDQINYKMWVNFASIDGTLTAPGGGKPIWGFRKQLQIGGHGTVEYLVTDPTGTGGGTNYQTVKAVAIDTTVYNSVTYVIPNYIIVQRSEISPAITCDANATPGALDINGQPQGCTCNAGFYGNGSVCLTCPQGAYCPYGSANYTQCVGVNATTVSTGAQSVNACYIACAAAPGGTTTGGSVTTAATCTCNAGYWGTGTTCTQCGTGTASLAGTTGPSVIKCPDCAAGTVQPSVGQTTCNNCNKNQYSINAPSGGRQTCGTCAAGTYAPAAPAGVDLCPTCPSGQSSLAGQDCYGFATSAALQGYLSSNSPCQGTWNVTTPAVCPTTCPYAGGTITGAVYTWSTSIAATGTGTCPQAVQNTSTASPVSCAAGNCNCAGGYTVAGVAVACPTGCGYPGSSIAPGVTYTWATTTAKTGTGQCPGESTSTTSPSTQVCASRSACAATTIPAGGPGYGPPATSQAPAWPAGLGTISYNTTTGVYTWVPAYTRSYNIAFAGASSDNGGLGASFSGTYTFTQGVNYYFVIGRQGLTATLSGAYYGGSGGGGTFIFGPTTAAPTPAVTVANCLFVAGGGGGTNTNYTGVGGNGTLTTTGYTTAGTGGTNVPVNPTLKSDGDNTTPTSIKNVGLGITTMTGVAGFSAASGNVNGTSKPNYGGFGGGGISSYTSSYYGGGGGGYTGGNCGGWYGAGPNVPVHGVGGGSYIISTGWTQVLTPTTNSGGGFITIS